MAVIILTFVTLITSKIIITQELLSLRDAK